jgi:hypothetical protein
MEKETIKSYHAGGVEKQRLILDKLQGGATGMSPHIIVVAEKNY